MRLVYHLARAIAIESAGQPETAAARGPGYERRHHGHGLAVAFVRGAPTAVGTGAGNDLGKVYALEFARRGCAVRVNDLGGGINLR